MDASDHDNGRAGIDSLNEIPGKPRREIHLAAPGRLPDGRRRRIRKADVGKTFGAQ
jgi:hypothetical protein